MNLEHILHRIRPNINTVIYNESHSFIARKQAVQQLLTRRHIISRHQVLNQRLIIRLNRCRLSLTLTLNPRHNLYRVFPHRHRIKVNVKGTSNVEQKLSKSRSDFDKIRKITVLDGITAELRPSSEFAVTYALLVNATSHFTLSYALLRHYFQGVSQ